MQLPWTQKKIKPRRSEMRLGRSYEQVAAQEEVLVRPAGRPRFRIGQRGFSLILAVVLVSLIAGLFISDAFYVYEAVVHGNSLVSSEEIYQGSEVEGYSIFFVDPEQVETAICSLADIMEAKVHVSLPNQMIVEVREREAQVIWQTGQERYGVDDDGTILPLRGEEPSISISDLDALPRQPGEKIDLEILVGVERYSSLLPEVRRFDYSQQYGLSFVNENGWRICLGDADNAGVKVLVMKALVQKLSSQGTTTEFIDLRFQGNPYYRLAGG
jgi:cell division septal protein FtsQ